MILIILLICCVVFMMIQSIVYMTYYIYKYKWLNINIFAILVSFCHIFPISAIFTEFETTITLLHINGFFNLFLLLFDKSL